MRWFVRYTILVAVLAVLVPAGVWLYVDTALSPESGPASVRIDPVPTGDPASKPVARTKRQTDSAADASPRGQRSDPRSAAGPLPGRPVVWGTVRTASGDIVSGELIKLASKSAVASYEVVSDDQGEFLIQGVEPARDYALTVTPHGMYRQYRRHDLQIAGGETFLDIVLEALRTGLLRGQVLNIGGRPVTDYPLVIHSLSKDLGRIATTTDSVGRFEVEAFPAGPFKVASQQNALRVEGLTFDPERKEPLTIVVDAGPHTLSGRVLDPDGQAASGATVLLSWSRRHSEAQSIAKRFALTGPGGTFAISGLGPGVHKLKISHGFRHRLQRGVMVGPGQTELTLYLETR